MESIINKLIFHQWQRKLFALVTAAIIWIFVHHSITSSKTIPSVPIRVINLPTDKTIHGLLPNGFLTKRATLTLQGTKDIIDQLEPGDVEVLLDVSNLPNDGIVQITKKNLVSLNPNINLLNHVASISHPEFVIKMSPILTEKIPIFILPPTGAPPDGYQFLDIWPMHLTQSVSGPEEQVLSLKNLGIEIVFDLNDISSEQLDALKENDFYDDEVNYLVPDLWKKVNIPFSSRGPEAINDPEAKSLQITFLRNQLLEIKNEMSIHVFYPLKISDTINPKTFPLSSSSFIQFRNHLSILSVPLFAKNVSKLFLEIVKDNMEINILAAPPTEREFLEWGVNLIDDAHLEDAYVAYLISSSKTHDSPRNKIREREQHFRDRFRFLIQQFTLYLSPKHRLDLQCRLEVGEIRVFVPHVLQKPLQKEMIPNAG